MREEEVVAILRDGRGLDHRIVVAAAQPACAIREPLPPKPPALGGELDSKQCEREDEGPHHARCDDEDEGIDVEHVERLLLGREAHADLGQGRELLVLEGDAAHE